ncbi:hypothetical protein ACIO1C_05775 [Streptomyces sp. NPDC087420]|uniref:hypothetical protein n=1 Tax=Streptomyces sp. NPDC087420 TaxID=3365785 RepID=UPI003835A845
MAGRPWPAGRAPVMPDPATPSSLSSDTCQEDMVRLSLSGVWLGQAAVAVLGVLVMSGEYGTGTIRTTLTTVPGRSRALAAKAAVRAGATLAAGATALTRRDA